MTHFTNIGNNLGRSWTPPKHPHICLAQETLSLIHGLTQSQRSSVGEATRLLTKTATTSGSKEAIMRERGWLSNWFWPAVCAHADHDRAWRQAVINAVGGRTAAIDWSPCRLQTARSLGHVFPHAVQHVLHIATHVRIGSERSIRWQQFFVMDISSRVQ